MGYIQTTVVCASGGRNSNVLMATPADGADRHEVYSASTSTKATATTNAEQADEVCEMSNASAAQNCPESQIVSCVLC